MSYEMLESPIELADDQLDFVAAGVRQANLQEGVVVVGANVEVRDVNVAVQALNNKSAIDQRD